MALIGYEWLIIIAILVVIFLWGPQKLPELARSLGLAKKEFEKTKQELTSPTSTETMQSSETTSLITAAKNLGIATEGKTKEEIAREVAERTAKSSR